MTLRIVQSRKKKNGHFFLPRADQGRIRVRCPKCESEGAWYHQEGCDIFLRCLCGFCRVVETTLESYTVTRPDSGPNITLPRRESKLYTCLAALVGLSKASTAFIANEINFRQQARQSNSDVASQLTVLRYKGLVVTVDDRKGCPGGSTWIPTDAALRLFRGAVS